MNEFELISVLIAAGGLIIATISIRKSRSLEKQQARLQKKQEELTDLQLELLRTEADRNNTPSQNIARADVRVSLEGIASDAKFYIRNWGMGSALDVKLSLKSLGKSSPIMSNDYDSKFPIPRLSPGSEVSLIAAVTFSTGVSFDLHWWWHDEDGIKREESTRLSL
jgi:hypothetical protein